MYNCVKILFKDKIVIITTIIIYDQFQVRIISVEDRKQKVTQRSVKELIKIQAFFG